jgi:hypothetical protein
MSGNRIEIVYVRAAQPVLVPIVEDSFATIKIRIVCSDGKNRSGVSDVEKGVKDFITSQSNLRLGMNRDTNQSKLEDWANKLEAKSKTQERQAPQNEFNEKSAPPKDKTIKNKGREIDD